MGGVFSTAAVRPRDRFGAWADEVLRRFGAGVATNCRTRDFATTMETALIGEMAISDVRGSPMVVTRTTRDVSRFAMDFFTLGLLVEGTGVISQRGREARVGPGDLVMTESRAPYQVRFDTPYRQIVLTLDRKRLESRLPQAARRTAIRVSGQSGPGRVTSAYLGALREQVPHLGIAEEALGECALDLVAVAFGGDAMGPGPTSDGGERRLLLARIKAFIEAHLGNTHLTPDFIAHRHGISRRYLYGLFAEERETVSEYIWQRRLAHCRDALADPDGVARSISEIAFHWGFNDASHFSRAFARAFGMSPRNFRLMHARTR
jgi:AraC-like DNA-binding protein